MLDERPEEQKWKGEDWDSLKGFPWEIKPRQTFSREIVSGADAERLPLTIPEVMILPPQQRRMYVTKKDVEQYGHTEGCVACTMVLLKGRTEVPHNDQCRMRMAELLAETEKGATAIGSCKEKEERCER